MARVRQFQTRDVSGVMALVNATHGSRYPRSELYSPAALADLAESPRFFAAVGVNEQERVVGFAALERSPLGPVAELGMVMVHETARGTGLRQTLGDHLLEVASELELKGHYVEVGTAETESQALWERASIVPCGVMLSMWPDYRLDDAEAAFQDRLSFVRYFRAFEPLPPTTLHLPSHYREMAMRIQARLGREAVFGHPAPPESPGVIHAVKRPDEGCLYVTVERIGDDTASALERATQHFSNDDELGFVCVDMPACEPAAVELCLYAEQLGYVFASLTPLMYGSGDGLRMQLAKSIPELSQIRLVNPFARELLTWVTSGFVTC